MGALVHGAWPPHLRFEAIKPRDGCQDCAMPAPGWTTAVCGTGASLHLTVVHWTRASTQFTRIRVDAW